MFRVLIAEDEELIREGLKNILDWENMGFQIVYTATDGVDAYQYLEKQSVDLIITDISMPQKNGLDLIKDVREIDKKVRVIILTGYDDFDYARDALRLDVEDYLLKPIDEEELEKCVAQIKIKLQSQKEKSSLFSLLKDNVEWENNIEIKNQFSFKDGFHIASALILWEGDEEKGREIYYYLKEHYKKEFLSFHYGGKEIYIIYQVEQEKNINLDIFYTIQNSIEIDCHVNTFFALSDRGEDWNTLKNLYQQTQYLKKYKIMKGYGSVIHYSDIKNKETKKIVIKKEEIKKLLISRDRKGLVEYFDQIFCSEMKEEYSLGSIYQSLLELAIIFQKVIEEFSLSHERIDFVQLIETLHNFEDFYEMKHHMIEVAVSVMNELNVEKKTYTPVISQILAEVDKDLGQTCNLKSLSAKYRVNTSYLGQLFQKEVGVSFLQYVNQLRNEKAKELILNTNMKINEIALKVGYTESNYFYRKFKQCYGISPNMMRELKCYDKK